MVLVVVEASTIKIHNIIRHDAVGVNCIKRATTDVKAQVPGICNKGYMLDNFA